MRRLSATAAVAFAALIAPAAASAEPPICCKPFARPGQIAFSPDARFVYVSDAETTLTLLRDPDTGALTELDAIEGGGVLQAVSKDGRFLYSASRNGGTGIFRRDPQSGRVTFLDFEQGGGGPTYTGDMELSPDGSQLYRTNLNTLRVYDRDPKTGLLTLRKTFKDGVGGVQMAEPEGLAVSHDGRFVYVAAPGDWPDGTAVARLTHSDDGELKYLGQTLCDCAPDDLELTPDGGTLLAGWKAFDRDHATGALSNPTQIGMSYGGSDETRYDAALAIAPGGTTAYGVNFGSNQLVQATVPAFTATRTYNDGDDDMRGLYLPNSVAVSPDGKFVYVAGGVQFFSGNGPDVHGTIAVLRRDPASGDLTFASLFKGQFFDGRPRGAPPPSIEINDGADYTNDRHVTLTLDLPRDGEQIEVSNDGGFGGATTVPWDYRKKIPWTLASTGPDRLPKTAYARIAESWGGETSTKVYTDDIVLDETAPTVESAEIHATRLRVKARDARSGVAKVQITARRDRPGKWHRYSKKRSYGVGDGRIYVRVRDRAHNLSRWRKAKR